MTGLTEVQAVALSVYARNIIGGSIEGALHEVERVLYLHGHTLDDDFRHCRPR